MSKNTIGEFYNITMTGKICYIFMCIEKYLVDKYPEKNWTPVAKHMWQWTEHWWDEAWDNYSEIVPEYIMEFDTFEETNIRAFEGKLSLDTYNEVKALYEGITDGKGEDELSDVLRIPIDFGNECEGTSVNAAEPYVAELIESIESILIKNNIQLPDKAVLKHFEYDRGKKSGLEEKEPGWGDFENTEYLSIILNK